MSDTDVNDNGTPVEEELRSRHTTPPLAPEKGAAFEDDGDEEAPLQHLNTAPEAGLSSELLDGAVMGWTPEQIKTWLASEDLRDHLTYLECLGSGLELLAMTRSDVELACSRRDSHGSFPSLAPLADPEKLWRALQKLRVSKSQEFADTDMETSGMNDDSINSPQAAAPRGGGCSKAEMRVCGMLIRHILIAVGVMFLIASLQSNPVPWNQLGSIHLLSEDRESDFKGDIFAADSGELLNVPVGSHPYLSTLLFLPALKLPAEAEAAFNTTRGDASDTTLRITLQTNKDSSGEWEAVGASFTLTAQGGKPSSHAHRFHAGVHHVDPLRLQINVTSDLRSIPFKMRVRAHPQLAAYSSVLGLAVLLCMYAMIISECVPKVVAAMLSSFAIIAIHNYVNESCSLREVVTWIDYETVCLLFGMMVMVGVLSETGVFEWLAVRAYQISDGDSWRLLMVLSALAGLMTAFLDNVTTVLLLAPVTMKLCDVLSLPPAPLLLAQVIFSNICGAVTPIGDPPNVIIANNRDVVAEGITFLSFTLHMLPGTVMACVGTWLYLRRAVRPGLLQSIPADERIKNEIQLTQRMVEAMDPQLLVCRAAALQRVAVLEMQAGYRSSPEGDADGSVTPARPSPDELLHRFRITNHTLFMQTGAILTVAVVLFFLHGALQLRISVAMISLIGAVSVMVVADGIPMHRVLQKVEWETLLFFAALFVVMHGLEELGLITDIADLTASVVKRASPAARPTVAALWVLLVSAAASAFIDNIPFTAAMVPVIVSLAHDPEVGVPLKPLVFALSYGTCLGGNGTVIGASANVVAVGLAQQQGHRISFGAFFKLGMPVTILTVLAATIYIVILVQLY